MRKALRKGSNNKCEEEGTQLKSPQKESESNLKLISEKEFTWHLKEIEQINQRSLQKERLKGFVKKLKKVAGTVDSQEVLKRGLDTNVRQIHKV